MAKKSSGSRRPGGQQTVRSNWQKYVFAGVISLAVVALGVLLYLNLQEPEALAGLVRSVGLERAHDEAVVYSDTDLPPTGGVHSGVWQNCGIYDEPIEAKNAVHSLEHGAVWITYQPDLPADDVDRLRDLVPEGSFIVLSPYTGLKSPVVLTAWGIQLEIDSASDDRIATFIDRYERGPQTPEPGAICHDGIGTPLS